VIAALAAISLLAADTPQHVEGEGEASLDLGQTEAVQRAKDLALRALILAACEKAARADPAIGRCTLADDRVHTAFEGLVTHLEVVEQTENRLKRLVHVRLSADVSLKTLNADELEAQRLYSASARCT
jgi:hypothetical protein